jgi:hypothetical protein
MRQLQIGGYLLWMPIPPPAASEIHHHLVTYDRTLMRMVYS